MIGRGERLCNAISIGLYHLCPREVPLYRPMNAVRARLTSRNGTLRVMARGERQILEHAVHAVHGVTEQAAVVLVSS